ncbi:MAG: surface-adhesin E family protein, partial [Pseudomonadota bacterium]|nr:surface-adhesin E family protein [Pseudomonadota bacterium]
PSYSEWTKVTELDGNTFYVDFERIRKHDGYVYYWILRDLLKPHKLGFLSAKTYNQGDCKLFRFKYLSASSHKEPMGGGTGTRGTPSSKWNYPPPNSSVELILKEVCSR